MAAPTLTSQTGSTWSDRVNTDEVTGTLTWNSGDRVLVVGFTEDQTLTLGTPTATGLTFTALGSPITTSNSCWMHVWQATAASSGSGTVTGPRATGTGTGMRGIHAFAWGGCTGFVRTDGAGANSTETVSVARTQGNSAVVFASADWSAGGTGGLGWTPAGQTQVQAAHNASGATAFCGYWGDQGSTGTTSYGTTGLAGSNFNKVAVEVLGTAGASPAAGEASGSGVGQSPAAALGGNTTEASGTALANSPAAAISALPAEASASGTAYGVTASSPQPPESLFTSETPSLGDNSDGTPGIVTATAMMFTKAGQITDVRWYCTTSTGGTWTGYVWEVTGADTSPGAGTGTQLASTTFSGTPTGGAWNTIPLPSPVTITPNTKLYKIGVFNDQGRYVATTNFAAFQSGGGGLTSGHIHAPFQGDDPVGLGSTYQGSYLINATAGYPSQPGNAANYFIDVLFAPAAFADADAAEATAAGAAGEATASISGSAAEATGAGSADNPTVTIGGSTSASATEASGAGAASGAAPAAGANAPEGAATGTAYSTAIALTAAAIEATAAGTAEWDAGSSISLDLIADNPVDGTGTAYNPAVSTASATNANATEAVGSGAANGPTPAFGVPAVEASATGSGNGLALAATAGTAEAAGAGNADNATVTTSSFTNAPATEATGAATADGATVATAVAAFEAAGTGTAYGPSASTVPQTDVPATEAAAAGAALAASAAIQSAAGNAAAAGAAHNPAVLTGADGQAFAGAAAGFGEACSPRARKRTPRPYTGTTHRPFTGITLRP